MNKRYIAAIASLALLGAATVAGVYCLSHYGTEYVVDDSKLYIGIDESYRDQDVILTLTAESQNGIKTASFASSSLSPMDGQKENIVFYDYASHPLLPLSGREVGLWLEDEETKLTVTTSVDGVIESGYLSIDEPGIWFVALPTEAGAAPSTSHVYCYKLALKGVGGN